MSQLPFEPSSVGQAQEGARNKNKFGLEMIVGDNLIIIVVKNKTKLEAQI